MLFYVMSLKMGKSLSLNIKKSKMISSLYDNAGS